MPGKPFNYEELERVFRATYHPKDPIQKSQYRTIKQCVGFQQGIIVDNMDPMYLGRVKVHFPMWGKNCVTGWIPCSGVYRDKDQGFFALPNIGERAICTFVNYNPERPVVIGTIYTQQNKAPIADNKGNYRKIFASPFGSTIMMDDMPGAERMAIYMLEGQMRIVMDENEGIEIVNELGDIVIECDTLIIESEDGCEFIIEDGFYIEADSIEYAADNNIEITSPSDVNLRANNITMQGNGVLAGNKPIALANDQVVGIDKHNIEVPTPKGLQTVPMIPHPYIGKLVDKLSQNVKINNRAAATKGSKSKNNAPMHLPMPPGVKFTKAPNNEGEVTSGTIPNVKINNKEAAVLGSKVKTCNDPMPQETCQIIAIGVAPKLPIEIPVTNPIDRSVINPRWDKAKAAIGEKVKLQVELKNQYENATVEYKIYPEGADPKKDQPIQKLYGRNEGGRSEVEWEFKRNDQAKWEAKYFFTAMSFGCAEVKSEIIEQMKPEFTNMKWRDNNNNVINKAKVEDIVNLTAEILNVPDDITSVKIKVYDKNNGDENNFITENYTEIKDKKISMGWEVDYIGDIAEVETQGKKAYKLPEYVFIIELDGIKSGKSSELEVKTWLEVLYEVPSTGETKPNTEYEIELPDGSKRNGKTDENGFLFEDNVPPGRYKLTIDGEEMVVDNVGKERRQDNG